MYLRKSLRSWPSACFARLVSGVNTWGDENSGDELTYFLFHLWWLWSYHILIKDNQDRQGEAEETSKKYSVLARGRFSGAKRRGRLKSESPLVFLWWGIFAVTEWSGTLFWSMLWLAEMNIQYIGCNRGSACWDLIWLITVYKPITTSYS